ncbi:hypothetical protein ACFZDK_01675 [Streptomyces sp. NPDC007901]|uniref:hypothetical protein n=1 Tax=Streptomyces sp. NPDC007901 TaxID=3364785 RepID=UPI0036EC2080
MGVQVGDPVGVDVRDGEEAGHVGAGPAARRVFGVGAVGTRRRGGEGEDVDAGAGRPGRPPLLCLAGQTPVLVHNCPTGADEEPVKLYRSPQKGNRASEARGLNPANHTDVDANGNSFAYLGDSESVVRQYAGQGVYEDGYHVFTMKPGFLDEFHPSAYRRFHDKDGGLQWIIDVEDIEDFNSFIDHSKTEWVPWEHGVNF